MKTTPQVWAIGESFRIDPLTGRAREEQRRDGNPLPAGFDYHHSNSVWDEDEIVRSPHRLRVPVAAPAGAYRIEAVITDRAGQPVAVPMSVAEGMLEPTDRLMVVPQDLRRRVDANLGERVALSGYDLAGFDLDASDATAHIARGEVLPVTLYWQAQQAMEASYKVFVHLYDGDGNLVAQRDSLPGLGAKPTTTWEVGEVVADRHIVPVGEGVMAGEYTVAVGLYEEESGERLAAYGPDGPLPNFAVESVGARGVNE